MAAVSFDGVTKTYPDGTTAVNGLDLEIADGEFMVLVGPSGCGKTTALRMVAGLEDISRGVLKIGDRIVNHVPSRDRDIAMVFQSYALYPHLTVYDNIAFGLKIKKVPKEEIEKRVSEAARILDLEPYLKRKPRALSGGQRQRVAMGRAIVREPSAFLMDEPLSNLDAKLRVQMRAEIARPAAHARRHDGLRHARPGRGHDDGRSRRGDAQGRAAAGGRSADALRPSGQSLRRRFHRQPRDEHAGGDARAEQRRDGRKARLAVDLTRRGDSLVASCAPPLRGQAGRARYPAGRPRRRDAHRRHIGRATPQGQGRPDGGTRVGDHGALLDRREARGHRRSTRACGGRRRRPGLASPTAARKPRRLSVASARAPACGSARTSTLRSTRAHCTSSTRRRVSVSTRTRDNRRKEPHREEPLDSRRRDHGACRRVGSDCHRVERSSERGGGLAQTDRLERRHQGLDRVRRRLDVVVRAEAVPGRDQRLQQEVPEREGQLPPDR